jgi:hypothetical protein
MNTFSIFIISIFIISGIYKLYINHGSEKKSKEDLKKIQEDRKTNVTMFVVKSIASLIVIGVILFFLGDTASAISRPLSSLSLMDIIKIIIALIFGYYLYKLWFSKDEYGN